MPFLQENFGLDSQQIWPEVPYSLQGKVYYGIGFKNDSGGYEICNPYFKGSCSPKDITALDFGSKTAAVFEGFPDFLSYLVIHQNQPQTQTNFVILNSVSFFEKARLVMEKHEAIRLYLERNQAGQNCSQHALSISKKYTDESHFYKNYKDLNEWLVNQGKHQSRKPGQDLR